MTLGHQRRAPCLAGGARLPTSRSTSAPCPCRWGEATDEPLNQCTLSLQVGRGY